jgi:hypothetical protein
MIEMTKKDTTIEDTQSSVINVSQGEQITSVTAGLVTDVQEPSGDIDLSEYQDEPYSMNEAVYTEQGRVGIDTKPPSDQEFFKVHKTWRMMGANILIHKKTKVWYLVSGKISKDPRVKKHIKKMDLFVAHFPSGLYFVIANASEPKEDDGTKWHSSAESKFRIIIGGEDCWVTMKWNNENSAYDPTFATGMCAEPKWPDSTGNKVIMRAFGEGKNVITDVENKVLQLLNGVTLV